MSSKVCTLLLHKMKVATLIKNGSTDTGTIVAVGDSLAELLRTASFQLGIQAKMIFTQAGVEISDVKCIQNEDVLYVSAGEPFIASSASDSDTASPETSELSAPEFSVRGWVLLNVGGVYFITARSTLVSKEPNSVLAKMFQASDGVIHWQNTTDRKGAVLIDRSPRYFEPVLNYLRHGQLVLDKNVNPQGVLEEAKYFGIESLVNALETLIQANGSSNEEPSLTRADVVKALISTSCTTELRFQGVNLAGADLSRLDLRHINFKYANLKGAKLCGANLSYCCLERTDLSEADLEGAILLGVKMLCANLEHANLKSCNMEDPAGNKANMEGVNLKYANLEGSQMAGVNLRVATLKNANLKNCDLRGTVLAGADLENCILSGSDLHEANLRGANLKNTAFEFMLTPLHMAQTLPNGFRHLLTLYARSDEEGNNADEAKVL